MKTASSLTKIATVYLVLFCIQFIPIEGYGVDYLKFTAMVVSPIILLWVPFFSAAVFWGLLYYTSILFSILMHDYFRSSTVIFTAMYLVMYAMFYNLVRRGAFSPQRFQKIMIGIIYAYAVCLLLQQAAVLVGIHYFPPINLMNPNSCTIDKLNALGIEPSSSARTLAVCFYGFLKINEIQNGEPIALKELWKQYKWTVLAFLYPMLTMGSGTAFVGMAILSLYFVKKKYLFFIIPITIALYFFVPTIDYKPLNRALATANAITTLDNEEIISADGSAATRLLPLVNTINNLDLATFETWFGYGIDTARNDGPYSSLNMIGCITDYGFLSYIISLFLVFSCCIRPFFSLPTLMFWCGIGGATNNIAYCWGLLMVFTCISYFNTHRKDVAIEIGALNSKDCLPPSTNSPGITITNIQ